MIIYAMRYCTHHAKCGRFHSAAAEALLQLIRKKFRMRVACREHSL